MSVLGMSREAPGAAHETIAERLGLTLSTFYRRLHHRWSQVAECLGVLNDVVAEA